MSRLTRLACLPVALVLTTDTGVAQKLTATDLVTRHVEQSLGAAGPQATGREITGSCRMTTATMGAGTLDGTFTMSSNGDASRLAIRFGADAYEGENVAFEGGKVDVGFAQPRTSMRSALGLFLSLNRVIVGEGLLGSVLNGRWPLAALAAREAKVSYEGVKKFDGRELHRLRYRAKKDQGDLTIQLYFEPDTYRHVASVYQSSRPQSMGATPETSSQQADQYFTLEERFSDFQTRGAATVPTTWVLRYARTGNTTAEWKYQLKVQ